MATLALVGGGDMPLPECTLETVHPVTEARTAQSDLTHTHALVPTQPAAQVGAAQAVQRQVAPAAQQSGALAPTSDTLPQEALFATQTRVTAVQSDVSTLPAEHLQSAEHFARPPATEHTAGYISAPYMAGQYILFEIIVCDSNLTAKFTTP
jgi:hypothetical protein